MACWKFTDGTVVRSGALVEGGGRFAQHLRMELFGLTHGEGPLVWLMQERDGAIDLDPHNNWLLNLWLNNEATLEGVGIYESDYTPQSCRHAASSHRATAPKRLGLIDLEQLNHSPLGHFRFHLQFALRATTLPPALPSG